MSKKTKQNETARAQQLIAGLQKHFANVASLTFASASHTTAEITSGLQTLVNLRKAVDDAKAASKAKLAAEAAQAPALLARMDDFASFVKVTFAKSPDVLADFGLKPKKVPTPLTAEQKAAAKAKRDATRKARGTRGSRQKKSVKGAVAGVVITPIDGAGKPVESPNAPVAPANAGSTTGGSTSHT